MQTTKELPCLDTLNKSRV